MARPETPALAADIIIELLDHKDRPFVLIERKYEPLGVAIPGGFVDIGETIEAAAVREAREETGLTVKLTAILGVYSDPDRDVRGHTVSVVYIAQAHGEPVARDDAAGVLVVSEQSLPKDLAFDHGRILADYFAVKQGKRQVITL
ncbi:MAG: NUDIX hydrolase [Gammaproteobacteria bacterium]|nr:NUDIX hydrolase [Gammaproteobacteria bacterium]